MSKRIIAEGTLFSGLIRGGKSLMCALLFVASFDASAALIELTGETWNITNSIDAGGGTWNESTLTFTAQTVNGMTADLEGFFDWVGGANSSGNGGRELFIGTLFDDSHIELFGQSLVDPVGIGLASYQAQVSSATQIVNGQWSAGGVVPGQWEAVRVIPEPTTLALLGLGLAGLGFSRRKKALNKNSL